MSPVSPVSFAVFETALGHCAIAWHSEGIVGVQLPEGSEAATRVRMQARFPGAAEKSPESPAAGAIAVVQAMLRGEAADVSGLALDMTGVPAFHQRVYALALAIPPGATTTYGEIAAQLGAPGAARAVGQAMGRNPFAPLVPCHRVLAAGGQPGGFSASGGVATKAKMLVVEGALAHTPGLFDQELPLSYSQAIPRRTASRKRDA